MSIINDRISCFFNPASKRTVMLAVDHGYFQGPTTGLEQPRMLLQELMPHCDALSPAKGVLYHCIDQPCLKPIILRISGGNSMVYSDPVELERELARRGTHLAQQGALGQMEQLRAQIQEEMVDRELANEGLTVSLAEAKRLGVQGVSVSIYVGSRYQRQTIENLARVVDETRPEKIAVLGITAVGKGLKRDARYLALASRIAAEHGADIVKTYYCENFEKVVDGCFVPVVIAGGKKLPELEALQMCADALQAGAAGVDMGRNIFQSENPRAMIQAITKVVHERYAPKEAYAFFQEQASQPAKLPGDL